MLAKAERVKNFIDHFSIEKLFGFNAITNQEERAKRVTLIRIVLLTAFFGFIQSLIYVMLGFPDVTIAVLAYIALSFLNLFYFYLFKNYSVFRLLQLILITLLPASSQLGLGGFIPGSSVALASLLSPMGALMFARVSIARIFFYFFVVVVIISGLIEYFFLENFNSMPRDINLLFFVFNTIAIAAVIYFLLEYFLVQKEKYQVLLQQKNIEVQEKNEELAAQQEEIAAQNEELVQQQSEILAQRNALEVEQQKSEKLLLNILPREIANELKENGKASPRNYSSATVLFTDFKDFTSVAEALSPEELLQELNNFFVAFDEIIEKHGLEKIKTIGDAYMCVGGVPIEDKHSVARAVEAAIEIRDFVEEQRSIKLALGKPCWEVRIGLHTGPLIAGVVGKNKFAFDIWGDTVNIASRMESASETGKVNISGDTYQLIKDQFEFTYRGKVSAKNKGDIDMYFVERISVTTTR